MQKKTKIKQKTERKDKSPSPKNSTRKNNMTMTSEKTPSFINKMEWVSIPNTDSNKFVMSPEKIENSEIFIYFFKRFMMQPKIRKYFVYKFRPDIPYYLVKIDWIDEHYEEKVKFIEKKLKEKSDFIIDIAEQLSSGGHWTSLKRENGILEYMDPDPFFYGNASEDVHKSFHRLVKKIPNPVEIYGTKNIIKTGIRAEKSIQNLHKNDKFCQSWSLFFLTTSHLYPQIPEKIRFQKGEVALYEDKERQFANFPAFLQNYLFLLEVWIDMFSSVDSQYNTMISDSMWKKWKSTKIIDKLKNIQRSLIKNKDNILSNIETQEDMFCLYEGFRGDYMVTK